jgi:glutathionylspermidine amidase/synthetase
MAYEIFPLPHATRVSDNSPVPWNNVRNGSTTRPVPGCILIWNEGAEFKWTGHVAVVTAVSDTYVRIAEQNVHDMSWEGKDYSRELPAAVDAATGAYHIYERYGKGGTIAGWKLLPADFKPAPIPLPESAAENQVQEGCSIQ